MTLTRRGFIGCSAFTVLAPGGVGAQVRDPSEPAALAREDGELLYVGATHDPVRIKVSPEGTGRFAMITQDMAPGSVVPIHLHEREDEIIFIRSGTGRATVGEREVDLAAGSMLYVPQGTWHGGENTGDEVLEWVAIYSPSGFEGYFREIAIPDDPSTAQPFTRERFERLNAQYGIRYPEA